MKIKFGGERRDLMNQKLSHTPESIQLLFDNPKLEIVKLLCLLNAFSENNKRQRNIGEILFYYTVVENEKYNGIKEASIVTNNFYRFQTKISELLIVMSNLDFIKVNANINDPFEKIKLKLLIEGEQFFEENKTEYIEDLFNEYKTYIEKIPFSTDVSKKLKEEGKY